MSPGSERETRGQRSCAQAPSSAQASRAGYCARSAMRRPAGSTRDPASQLRALPRPSGQARAKPSSTSITACVVSHTAPELDADVTTSISAGAVAVPFDPLPLPSSGARSGTPMSRRRAACTAPVGMGSARAARKLSATRISAADPVRIPPSLLAHLHIHSRTSSPNAHRLPRPASRRGTPRSDGLSAADAAAPSPMDTDASGEEGRAQMSTSSPLSAALIRCKTPPMAKASIESATAASSSTRASASTCGIAQSSDVAKGEEGERVEGDEREERDERERERIERPSATRAARGEGGTSRPRSRYPIPTGRAPPHPAPVPRATYTSSGGHHIDDATTAIGRPTESPPPPPHGANLF
eukprot:scaffold28332_cov31-Tisochrysis_lutea.AAC.14